MTNAIVLNEIAVAAIPVKPVQLVPSGVPIASTGISFLDVLDAVNPLQHIPVISSVYRAATGNSISAIAQIAGGALFGGLAGGVVSGVVASLADVAVKEVSGRNVAEHVISTLTDNKPSEPSKDAVKLIAVEGQSPATAQETTLNEQAREAASLILRNESNAGRVAGQYQRVQTLDIANKLLINNL